MRLLDVMSWLDIDVEMADDAASLVRLHRGTHQGLQLADCLIAAGVGRLGAALLTQNVRHFRCSMDSYAPTSMRQAQSRSATQ